MFPSNTDRETPTLPAGAVLASANRRILGYLLDSLITAVPAVITLSAMLWGQIDDSKGVFDQTFKVSDNQLFVGTVVSAVTWVIYQTVMIGLWGRTVGKFATGTKLVRADTGAKASWENAAIRSLIVAIASSVPQVGTLIQAMILLWATFDGRRQGLHDKAAGTIVVMNSPPVTER